MLLLLLLSILIFICHYLLAAPLSWSKVASKFLQYTKHHIRTEVTGKRVNRGVRLELEIPVKYFFGDVRVVKWVENSLEKLDNELNVKVKKCIK